MYTKHLSSCMSDIQWGFVKNMVNNIRCTTARTSPLCRRGVTGKLWVTLSMFQRLTEEVFDGLFTRHKISNKSLVPTSYDVAADILFICVYFHTGTPLWLHTFRVNSINAWVGVVVDKDRENNSCGLWHSCNNLRLDHTGITIISNHHNYHCRCNHHLHHHYHHHQQQKSQQYCFYCYHYHRYYHHIL